MANSSRHKPSAFRARVLRDSAFYKITLEEFGGMKVAEYSSTLTSQQRNKVVRDFDLNHIQL